MMQKKIITIIIAIIINVALFSPFSVFAVSNQDSFIEIDSNQELEMGDLFFSDISFRDYSSSSTQSFGLTGFVKNNSNQAVNYTSTVYYYDVHYQLIGESSISKVASPGFSMFNHMSGIDLLGNYSSNEIYYYRLFIEEDEVNSSDLIDTPSKDSQYNSYDYVIDQYDIDIIVHENNVLDVTETITAYFHQPKHGIIRVIPLKNYIRRNDGTTSYQRAKIKNIRVNDEFLVDLIDGNYQLQIGSSAQTLTGIRTYVIQYSYYLGKDTVKEYDELYYNLIGNNWDTVIGNVSFSITMPKSFDSSKLGFSAGLLGSTSNSKVQYEVSENTISGRYQSILDVGEGLTIRCELPQGYFIGTGIEFDLGSTILIFISILFLAISIFIWYRYGKNRGVVETIEFYPPKGLNSLEVGFLYKGIARNKDVTSLLIYLADKGYLEIGLKNSNSLTQEIRFNGLRVASGRKSDKKIIELENKILKEKSKNPNSKKIKYYENMLNIYKNIDTPIDYRKYGMESVVRDMNKDVQFVIRKIKDYDGNNENEKLFFDGLFQFNGNQVTDKILSEQFFITKNLILHHINHQKNREQIIEKKAFRCQKIISLMIPVLYILNMAFLMYTGFYSPIEILASLVFLFLAFNLLLNSLFAIQAGAYKPFLLVINLFVNFLLWYGLIFPVILQDNISLIVFIVGLICILGMSCCYLFFSQRTRYGNEMLGKIKGFRRFLKVAKKEELEALVEQNPNYFYDVLPYAYVLGVSDKWIKKFESIIMEAPTWYKYSTSFKLDEFEYFMDRTMKSVSKTMRSEPLNYANSGGSGDSSSGGGSSGGGSGGGGGSSW